MIQPGDTVNSPLGPLLVIAVEWHNATRTKEATEGTLFARNDTPREYSVWSVGREGELLNPTVKPNALEALNAFSVRTLDRLYRHFNTSAPDIIFEGGAR